MFTGCCVAGILASNYPLCAHIDYAAQAMPRRFRLGRRFKRVSMNSSVDDISKQDASAQIYIAGAY